MREILFRGKSKDSGEWIYGEYSPEQGKLPPNIFPNNMDFVNRCGDTCIEYEGVAVIPETVGQYTDLLDKNGNKIFEGDILSAHFDDMFTESETHAYVLWRVYGWHIREPAYGENGIDILDNADEWEVIGNIYDNPELLDTEKYEEEMKATKN